MKPEKKREESTENKRAAIRKEHNASDAPEIVFARYPAGLMSG
jgi:hypothetical protein